MSIVDANTPCHVQPVKNLVTQTCRSHITFLVVQTEITVSNPVRILHTEVTFALWPELYTDLSRFIPTLEILHDREIVSTREKISRNQWIGVLPLIGHITVVLENIACTYIQFHLIIQETGRITESKIISVIPIVGNHPCRIDGSCRKESLIFICSGRQRNGICIYRTRIKKIIRFISCLSSRGQLRSPAINIGISCFTITSCTITSLEIGHLKSIQPFNAT